MNLVQVLLPLYDNEGASFGKDAFDRVAAELAERFGGVTAFVRSPAKGLWTEGGGTVRDDVVIYEVMTEEIDRVWWVRYREDLKARFRQEQLVIRAWEAEQL